MSEAKNEHHATEANRLLAGAAKVVANARSCWLATAVAPGDAKLRPMGRLPNEPGEDEWIIRFITDGRSRKAADMRRDNRVTIIFQNEPDNAFVSVIGAAVLYPAHGLPGGARARAAADVAALVLYVAIAVLALVGGAYPERTEAVLLTVLLFLGFNIAWLFLFTPLTPAATVAHQEQPEAPATGR